MTELKLQVKLSDDEAFMDKLVKTIETEIFRALYYAPSSPVSPQKAHEIEVWYGKIKQVHLAAKE